MMADNGINITMTPSHPRRFHPHGNCRGIGIERREDSRDSGRASSHPFRPAEQQYHLIC